MNDYNFLNLSPFEFENLSRDLLQEKLGVFIESFTSGKDKGIDLRIAKNKRDGIVIQAKRYDQFKNLKSNLKKEIHKIVELKPSKYLITTSVGLTPSNKDEIKSMFEPYIKCTGDIIGKNDLNNLLGLFPKIEKKYYKLWLSSTEILDKIIHSRIINQSEFEIEEIKEILKIYVQNESFNEAFEILKKFHYVVISGIPGIGKTTLARMLVYQLLSKEFDEFIYMSESVNDGYTFYKEGENQVFFFDDFLGKNFLEIKHGVNEESKIIKFIEKIKKSKNKLLILTTREYILSQAKNTYEVLNNPSVDLAKCTLDLSKYTKLIKAEILYNHLFFANVPIPHLENLLKNKLYMKIIEHPNYNPRIIESFVQKQFWNYSDPADFSKSIMLFFDNPECVWLHAFENTISRGSQVTLLVLATIGTPVLLADLRIAINSFLAENNLKYPIPFDSICFQKTIKELEGTFTITKMDSYGGIAVEFQNPSVHDFLVNYLNGKNEIIKDLIKSFLFTNQFFTIFTVDENSKKMNQSIRILLKDESFDLIVEKIVADFNLLKNSTAHRVHYQRSNKFSWYKHGFHTYSFLIEIWKEFENVKNDKIEEIILTCFQRNIEPKVSDYWERYAYLELLSNIDKSNLKYNCQEIISSFGTQIDSIDFYNDFKKLEKIFPDEFVSYTRGDDFSQKLNDIIKEEIDYVEGNDIENLVDELKELQSKYSIDLVSDIDKLNKKNTIYRDEIEAKMDAELDNYKSQQQEYYDENEKEEIQITNLFDSLIDK